jgi:GH25 family lysozyme M1 (1,4-beta-N-acetylmuramidase)
VIDYARGIDVNHYHRPKSAGDWAKVFGSGISFVGVKATQGPGYVDPTFVDSRAAAAPAVGRLLYHFADTTPWGDQADHFCTALGGTLDENEIPVLDLERGPKDKGLPFAGIGRPDPTAEVFMGAEDWLGTVSSNLGKMPLVYTRGLWLSLGNPILQWAKAFGLWVARYRALERGPGDLPASWDDWRFWQWTDGGATGPVNEVPGVGAVDSNVFNGTVDELRVWVEQQ